ncbi:MAG: hypothetical protein ABJ251_00890 [Paracoccaceae bacterium]
MAHREGNSIVNFYALKTKISAAQLEARQDGAQHILARRKQGALEEILDCFKTMLKGPDWTTMLVMSGIPELADYIPYLEQLCRKVTHVSLDDVDFQEDTDTVNDL